MSRPWALGALFVLLVPAATLAQEAGKVPPGRIQVESAPRPTAAALRTDAPPTVDGRLDEPVWQQAVPLTGFVQSRPNAGAPATEETVVRFVYDDRALYIGAICYDSEPDRLFVSSLKQDFNSGSSDVFGVTLDTYLDRRNGFMFLVNPEGALKDVQIFDDSRSENQAWEGPIRVETTRNDEGWTVEIEIPFSTLRFNPSGEDQTWGLQILRRIRRKAEDTFWAPLDRRDQIHKMSKAGTLTGFRGVTPGLNLRVKPYALAQDQTGTLVEEGRGGTQADIGFDVKFGVTPGLTLDLTYNTDFAQVEVDQEQVNLTRFPLFFPEKRDFFVENSGTFSFGDQSERSYRTGVSLRDFTLFHSRRIGLTGGGEPIPILGGARLTGRTGGFEVGLLNLQMQSSPRLPAENFLGTTGSSKPVRDLGHRRDLREPAGDRRRHRGVPGLQPELRVRREPEAGSRRCSSPRSWPGRARRIPTATLSRDGCGWAGGTNCGMCRRCGGMWGTTSTRRWASCAGATSGRVTPPWVSIPGLRYRAFRRSIPTSRSTMFRISNPSS